MKLCKVDNFINSDDGVETSYVSVPDKYKDRINATLDLLAQ